MGSKDAYYDGTHTGDDRSAQIYSDIDLFFGPKTGSTIEFYVVNAPTELVSMEVLLERVR